MFPEHNRVVIRGGDSALLDGLPLRAGLDIVEQDVTPVDMPRWLELFAVGQDVTGSLVIEGDAQKGLGTQETIEFNGTKQNFVTSRPTKNITVSEIHDTDQSWVADQALLYRKT